MNEIYIDLKKKTSAKKSFIKLYASNRIKAVCLWQLSHRSHFERASTLKSILFEVFLLARLCRDLIHKWVFVFLLFFHSVSNYEQKTWKNRPLLRLNIFPSFQLWERKKFTSVFRTLFWVKSSMRNLIFVFIIFRMHFKNVSFRSLISN